MSDVSTDQSATSDNDGGQEPTIFDLPGDWLLRNIMGTVVGLGVEIGVTLTVGGSVISGIAINGEKYMDLFADGITNGASEGEVRHSIGEGLRAWKQIYQKPDAAGDDWKPSHIGYVHLKDAQFYIPGQEGMPRNGLLWRGRLDSIDGFSLGNFSTD